VFEVVVEALRAEWIETTLLITSSDRPQGDGT
jgi:hypothetical protein